MAYKMMFPVKLRGQVGFPAGGGRGARVKYYKIQVGGRAGLRGKVLPVTGAQVRGCGGGLETGRNRSWRRQRQDPESC